MDKNILAVALGSMLLGGVAVAAYSNFNAPSTTTARPAAVQPMPVNTVGLDAAAAAPSVQIAPATLAAQDARPQVEYAQVLDVRPVSRKAPRFAAVVGTDPVRETSTTSVPHQECNDVVVQERLPERDGNVGGTVVGAVIGGLVGSRIGHGDGRRAAEVGGAVAGGFIGNRVDRNHIGGRVVDRTDRQCREVTERSQTSRVVAYNVTYRNPDGTLGTLHTRNRPGSRITLPSGSQTVGYDVTYRYQGQDHAIRMAERPGSRLTVVDGRVLTSAQTSARLASR